MDVQLYELLYSLSAKKKRWSTLSTLSTNARAEFARYFLRGMLASKTARKLNRPQAIRANKNP
jgi:hypothetical protein